ncbi:MAG: hypothetical protein A2015_01565 [Spirochaetes bacterium GWF1_31_7]|nr:MAG: hypothetical protein A2015_01565 [Spirochaetes bacterium GWF1_31_7]OHD52685.1 MAG: hypothetical protein A2Y29_04835 [Spirochaetes bacterium GWE2_31_10]OHD82769.1 MAG: hypothetical protein A2355_14410 [Spirochaetes bacterium RIFOXYB1_FULL_32_8]HBD94748.1 hypothetical protein [Spirochaetia bacterium]HBI39076.1 hypothetical protein [Spirochaetia bacterium]
MNNKTILAIPVFLILIMSFIFRYVSVKYGVTVAILLGFLIYQIIWCMVIPLSILQKQALFSIFIQKEKLFTYKNTLYIVLLLLPIVGAIPLFILNISKYPFYLFFIGLPLTIANGISEEILWRGLFIKTQKNFFLKVVYPAILFSIWHICPQLVYIDKPFSEIVLFSAVTLPLGFAYSLVAAEFDSIRYTSLSHAISGILAFGIPLSTSFASLFGINY